MRLEGMERWAWWRKRSSGAQRPGLGSEVQAEATGLGEGVSVGLWSEAGGGSGLGEGGALTQTRVASEAVARPRCSKCFLMA